ncbi:alpha/beta hydrolase [candidate division KSB1 bacterium]|nr:alpha/beta hydrolase [candidate division KSB1 bacterium]
MKHIGANTTSLFLALISVYLLFCILIYLFQDKFIFFPVKLNDSSFYLKDFRKYEITIIHKENNLHGWLLNPENSNLIIYYGGNAEEVSYNIREFKELENYSILLLNYRGYGKSQGSPGQEQLYSDALFVYDYMVNNFSQKYEKIIVFGRSLGSSIALYVANNRHVHGAILVTPFASIRDLAQKVFPYLPVKLLLKHPFDSIDLINNFDIPTLVLVAENDEIVPYSSTARLIDQLGDSCKSVVIKNATHNDIQFCPLYWEEIKSYLYKYKD